MEDVDSPFKVASFRVERELRGGRPGGPRGGYPSHHDGDGDSPRIYNSEFSEGQLEPSGSQRDASRD